MMKLGSSEAVITRFEDELMKVTFSLFTWSVVRCHVPFSVSLQSSFWQMLCVVSWVNRAKMSPMMTDCVLCTSDRWGNATDRWEDTSHRWRDGSDRCGVRHDSEWWDRTHRRWNNREQYRRDGMWFNIFLRSEITEIILIFKRNLNRQQLAHYSLQSAHYSSKGNKYPCYMPI